MLRIKRKHNLRDIGGFFVEGDRMVGRDKIFRSGSLYNLSNTDALQLERSGVSCIIDLRSPVEVDEKPDTPIPGVKMFYIPFLSDSAIGITHQSGSDPVKIVKNLRKDKAALQTIIPDMEALYLKMVSDPETQKQIGVALNVVIDTVLEGKKILFHCTAGKDRTGVLAAIILNLLGVSRTDILKDYIRTNRSAYPGAVKKGLLIGAMTYSFNMGLSAYQIFMAQQRHLIKTMSIIRKKYGSIDNYATVALGIAPERIDLFRKKMLVHHRK
ncbi:MAG: tyrosine-protein phosphatase [Bacteroidaceae bacterium]|nr:tyrosine-protein phosphatase [Bacteroidaceae bacterium]